MPLIRCTKCGCIDNTALCNAWSQYKDKSFLCSECDPEIGKWHGKFEKKSAKGYYYDENGHIYGPEEVDKKTMEWTYNRRFKMEGRYDE